METNGAIERYVALVNPSKWGKGLTVYCTVTLIKHQEKYFKEFVRFASTLSEVVEIIYVSGSHDYLLKVILGDMKKISRLDIISNIHSSVVVRQIHTRLSFL